MAEQSKTDGQIHLDVVFGLRSKFTGRSVENGVPVTRPLHNLEDTLAWKPDDHRDAGQCYSISTVPYYGKNIPKGSTKTLVCHDMAGGYLDDRFVQGCLSQEDKWYYLVYWDIVDTFVYFSHNFVTIPPVGWINSAHTNGVAVLGTIITEGDEGFQRCQVIFSCEWLWQRVADRLVEIAKYYRFEGWLLNIENELDGSCVQNVQSFVKYLTDKMHDAIEGSQVIWYDSVTKDGILAWQNELNEQNKVYFDACDGIFLNYNWTKDSLDRSAKLAKATDRVEDVYVGVDVFGRGCYGGGGLNSTLAVEVIRRFNLSAAIFAPGWTKEVLGTRNFERNQQKFWTFLSKHCNTHSIIFDSGSQSVATDFNPGIYTETPNKDAKRFLHLNRQALMPCLSDPVFSPLVIGKHRTVSLAKDLSVILFKTNLCIKSGVVIIFVVLNPGSKVTIRLHLKGGETRILQDMDTNVPGLPNRRFYEVMKLAPGSIIDEIVCKTTQRSTITRFVLAGGDTDSLGEPLHTADDDAMPEPLNIADGDATPELKIGVSLGDATWKKDEKNIGALFLSCTIKLANIDPALPIKMSCKSWNSQYEERGISRSDKFRVNNWSVPDPIFHGPDTKITLKAEQLSPVYPVRRPDLPARVGELIVTYGENMPYDPSK